ncbi:uncharacterized protein K452DRAFT_198130, partial [Aplosporella prunicola CBS 121167]
VYERLDLGSQHIRLLVLFPGRWTDPLSCALSLVSLNDRPIYEAVSYAWGNRTSRRTIHLDDRLYSVTAALEIVLRHPTKARIIWVDALCINQSDPEERTHQVNMMCAIYSLAQEVFLFLG